MANLMPAELPDDAPHSERVVHERLSALPDDWTVLWHVPVKRFEPRRRGLSEIDFLLLHATMGIIALEVKGGDIKVEERVWYTKPYNSPEWKKLQKSPFDQVVDASKALERYLLNRERMQLEPLTLIHAVAFPDLTITTPMGPDAPRPLIIDKTDLEQPESALKRVRAEYTTIAPLPSNLIGAILKVVNPSFTLTVLSSARAADTARGLEEATRHQVQMVDDQVSAFRQLLGSDRAVVTGGAGTGKTVIAAKLATSFADARDRTLLLCHRMGVQSFLQTLLEIPSTHRKYAGNDESELHVTFWHRFAIAVGEPLGVAPLDPRDPKLDEKLLEYRGTLPRPYDAIVIDEGQEFTSVQIDALKWLLVDPENSPIYIFADPFQHSGLFSTPASVRHRDKDIAYRWTVPSDMSLISLNTNCRNSIPISELAALFYPTDPPRALIEGPKPKFHVARRSRVVPDALMLVASLIKKEKFRPGQILLARVNVTEQDVTDAGGAMKLPTVPLNKLYRFPLTSLDVRVVQGSADEIQGLESDVVVILLESDGNKATARELYISLSRARGVLHIVSDMTPEAIRKLAHSVDEADPRGEGG